MIHNKNNINILGILHQLILYEMHHYRAHALLNGLDLHAHLCRYFARVRGMLVPRH